MANVVLTISMIAWDFGIFLEEKLQALGLKLVADASRSEWRVGDTVQYRKPVRYDPFGYVTERVYPVTLKHDLWYQSPIDPAEMFLPIDTFSRRYLMPAAHVIANQVLSLCPKGGVVISAGRELGAASSSGYAAARSRSDQLCSYVMSAYDPIRNARMFRFGILCGFYSEVVQISPWTIRQIEFYKQEKRRLDQKLAELRKTA